MLTQEAACHDSGSVAAVAPGPRPDGAGAGTRAPETSTRRCSVKSCLSHHGWGRRPTEPPQWTVGRNSLGDTAAATRSMPVIVMAPRPPSQGSHWCDLLRLAEVPLGEKLRGSNMALYLLVEAADGYRVVFALPELDPAFTERCGSCSPIMRDGQPLCHGGEDRCALWSLSEKRHARWVRQVGSCTVRRAPDLVLPIAAVASCREPGIPD